jgi:NADPH-dependent glutamate synthase beta subunit-like oxidoreductase
MGFLHVEHGNLVKELNIATDNKGNIIVDKAYKTTEHGFFAAGDAMIGASLVVHAINHGRRVADSVNQFLREN